MHTPGEVGLVGAYLRLVLLHDLEAERLAMGHRLKVGVAVKVIIKALPSVSACRHKATVSAQTCMLQA